MASINASENYFLIDGAQLSRLRSLAKRLYTEKRMDGNAMRDAAQTIDAIVRVAEQLPAPEED